jgi:osmotically-inducible protein OsmY
MRALAHVSVPAHARCFVVACRCPRAAWLVRCTRRALMTIRKLTTSALCLTMLAPVSIGVGACATTQPVTEQTSDSVITGRVGRRLTADPDVQRYQIDVDTLDGVVYLRGKVDSDAMKTSAEKIAQSTDGVRKVVNELVVDPNREGDATDGDVAIKARVGTALSGDDDVRRVNVDVDVTDGVVTLSGIVHNQAEADEAVRIAREQEGVLEVKNELKVEQLNNEDPEKKGKVDDDGDREDMDGKTMDEKTMEKKAGTK